LGTLTGIHLLIDVDFGMEYAEYDLKKVIIISISMNRVYLKIQSVGYMC